MLSWTDKIVGGLARKSRSGLISLMESSQFCHRSVKFMQAGPECLLTEKSGVHCAISILNGYPCMPLPCTPRNGSIQDIPIAVPSTVSTKKATATIWSISEALAGSNKLTQTSTEPASSSAVYSLCS